jgi:DNA-directed RNA polymerase subunit RPC12/RpoP
VKIGKCPACGAPVKFRSEASVVAVCEYCNSTLLRQGEVLENLGKMAALQEDPTLIQLATEGAYKGSHFAVIGRIQLRYEDGLWNEWHLLFDDQRSGWLGEAAGEFYVTFEKPPSKAPPPFSGIAVEQRVALEGSLDFQVTDIESATCIAGEGELPFTVGPGYEAPVVDLRRGAEFATIDYSDDPPRVYFGERVEGLSLKLTNLKVPEAEEQAEAKDMGLLAFDCPNCGAPLKLSDDKSKSYGCTSCGSLLDLNNRKAQLAAKAQSALEFAPPLALGSKGKLDGTEWEVIGYMRRASNNFSWGEYLLFSRGKGYRWLAESNGHWSYLWNASQPAKAIGTSAWYGNKEYQHFEGYEGRVTHVLGEFYWKVRFGDTAQANDYVAPPEILSSEKTPRELTWTVGRYMPVEEVQGVFKPAKPLPAPRGIAPNQPNPHAAEPARLWKLFCVLTLAIFVLQMGFAFRSVKVYSEFVKVPPGEGGATTQPFTIRGTAGNLVVRNDTDLNNSWADFTYTLVDPKTGKTWNEAHEVSYYAGVDDGESWNEGSRTDDVVFYGVPPGEYRLNITSERPQDANTAVAANLKLEQGHPSWLNWLVLQLALLILPFWGTWRERSFENRRWADSDHPRGGGSGDDDDD